MADRAPFRLLTKYGGYPRGMILHLPVATGQVLVAEGKAMSDISAKAVPYCWW